ncbi:hypothetical protein MC45_01360 [Sphingomonas taxi]|uniref:DUF2254 domain-containing protein n=1 Tax=Sphingomonas taxi TaxID=1549858 RepID=A0A097ECI5_9SPHN|nr:DUF2254 domain-containing protein [Sphingomonas taxi]AIT05285.1 hypothetical protein MC45_01360 [Sphingomonas taxi]
MISKDRIGWLVRRITRKIWFRAALISTASVVLAAFAGIVARAVPYHFTGDIGQDAVGTVLEIIASSMLAVTTFSLTAMVSAYSSATQLATPRATQLLISDRMSQNALSTFLGAFIFAIVGIIGLQTRLYGGQGRVLLLIATILLVALVVITLLRWIAHLAAFGRMSDVIDRVEDAARSAMQDFAKDPYGGGRAPIALPADARPIVSDTIGYVTHIDFDRLLAQARRHGIAVHVAAIPGTLVHKGRPLLHVIGSDEPNDGVLAQAFTIERHRDFDHDPRLGLIALGEIAGRALAPATNDPGTAVEVLNALLRTLSELPAQDSLAHADLPSVYVPRPSTDELIRAGFAPIVREGAGEEEVAIRAFKVLAALGEAMPHAREVAQALAGELKDNVERVMLDKASAARTLTIYSS